MELIQTEFLEGELVEDAAWHVVILILKGGGEYRGIGSM